MKEEFLKILSDVWLEHSIKIVTNGKEIWSAGSSNSLKQTYRTLLRENLIDKNGLPLNRACLLSLN